MAYKAPYYLFLRLCIVLIFIAAVLLQDVDSGKIKIVSEPVKSQFQQYLSQYSSTDGDALLALRVKPSKPAGPFPLLKLANECFSFETTSYKYKLCLFNNITQHENVLWNKHHAILGVWRDWEIVNDSFVAMIMDQGDDCFEHRRQSKVYIKCGYVNKVISVNEPKTCRYSVVFETPLICYDDAMLVYPYMNSSLQHELDQLDVRLLNDEVTQKGSEKWREDIFADAGFILDVKSSMHRLFEGLPSEYKDSSTEESNNVVADDSKDSDGHIDEVSQVVEDSVKELKKLRKIVYLLANATWLQQCNDDINCLYNKTVAVKDLKTLSNYSDFIQNSTLN